MPQIQAAVVRPRSGSPAEPCNRVSPRRRGDGPGRPRYALRDARPVARPRACSASAGYPASADCRTGRPRDIVTRPHPVGPPPTSPTDRARTRRDGSGRVQALRRSRPAHPSARPMLRVSALSSTGPGARSRQRLIDHDIARDPHGAFEGVPVAVDPRMPLERAAEVELLVDDRPVPVDLHSLELREVLAPAGCLGVLAVLEVEPPLQVIDLVVAGDR